VKTQPYYRLATDPTTKTRQRNKERQKGKRTGEDKEQRKTKNRGRQGKTKNKNKNKNKWAYRKLPTYMTWSKIILKMPKAEIPNRNFF
jgi:hypothetical protein